MKKYIQPEMAVVQFQPAAIVASSLPIGTEGGPGQLSNSKSGWSSEDWSEPSVEE